MRSTFWLRGFCGAVILLVAPTFLTADTGQCKTCQLTPASNTLTLRDEASTLLQQMKTQAIQVRDLADKLQASERDGENTTWQMDGETLMTARHQVNSMDTTLRRLLAIRPETLPWQQAAIDRVAPKMIELTDYVQDALLNLNHHHETIHTLDRSYAQDTQYIYKRASAIANSIQQFEEYAAAKTELRQLSPPLGMTAGS